MKTMLRKWLSYIVISLIFSLVLILMSATIVQANIDAPQNTSVFFRTSGPDAPLEAGDYRSNQPVDSDGNPGDGLAHDFIISIACTADEIYVLQLYDPAIATSTEAVLDTVRGRADDTTFSLNAPDGSLLEETVFAPDSTTSRWVNYATIALNSAPEAGVDCGKFRLKVSTAADDDNGWRMRLLGLHVGGDSGGEFDPSLGPDGIIGTGDESWIAIVGTTFQHSEADDNCQQLYWYVDEAETPLTILNFNMNNRGVLRYFAPQGVEIEGSSSGSAVWNDLSPREDKRPAMLDMELFDFVNNRRGNATRVPILGQWTAEVCSAANIQYMFEVVGYPLFMQQMILPEMTFDNNTLMARLPLRYRYHITVTNNGAGAAMPIPQPEIIELLAEGVEFVSCSVNAPLVGSCAETEPGSGVVAIELDGQSETIPAFLPGLDSAPNNSGRVTITVNIPEQLDKVIHVTDARRLLWTDVYENEYLSILYDNRDITMRTLILDSMVPRAELEPTATAAAVETTPEPVATPGTGTETFIEATPEVTAEPLSVAEPPRSGSYSRQMAYIRYIGIAAGAFAALVLGVSIVFWLYRRYHRRRRRSTYKQS